MLGIKLLCIGSLLLLNNNCEGSNALEKFGEGNQGFSSDVYALLANLSDNDSIVFSPLSAQLVLSQTSEGARNDTERQLVSALRLPSSCQNHKAIRQLILNITTDIITLVSANRIYVAENYELLQPFVDISENVYRADVESVDFGQSEATANLINSWIEEQTNNKIRNLISSNSLSSMTRLVLVNTLYLNGKWQTPFLPELTMNTTFYLSNGSTKEVRMMNSNTQRSSIYKFLNSSELRASFLQLDVRDSNLSMNFILPNNRQELTSIENNLEPYLRPQNYTTVRISVSIPTFEITSNTIDLRGILQELGVTDLFNPGSADLSGISTETGLYVSEVVQKAFINVTETGVEAAAATAVGVSTTAVLQPPTLSFIADHPFVYSISDRITGIVYFVGRYTGL